MSAAHIKDFGNEVLIKTKIALAVSIIANTPPGKTAEQYAKELQDEIDKQWLYDENSFENETVSRLHVERIHLKRKQRFVVQQLSYLIPSSDGSYQSTSSFQDSGFSSSEESEGGYFELPPLFSEYEKPIDFSTDVRKILGDNLDFERGVVRLQALIGNTGSQVTGSKGNPNCTMASFIVQHTLGTASAEAMVRKSIQGILGYLCGIALQSFELATTLANWEGSLVEHSVALLRTLSSEEHFQNAIAHSTGLVAKVLITDMLKNYGLEKNIKLENESTLLLQLCGNSGTCAETLKILIDKINVFTTNNVAFQSDPTMTPSEKTIFFESCYYIFDLTSKLLTRYFLDRQTCKITSENPPKKEQANGPINELWREFWEQNRSQIPQNKCRPNKALSDREIVQAWLKCLKNAANVFSVNYPLISLFANNCALIIASNQSESTQ